MPAMTARMRWLIGGGAVVAAVAIVVVAMIALGSRPVPESETYVPRDSDVVAELRPDFPGDQLSKVGNLLAHFPGFKDQSILGQKIDETLAKLTTSATNGSVDYATQVKPWLAGPLFAGGRATPAAEAQAGPGGDYVIAFTTDGSVTCDPFTHASTTVETYRGITIHEPAPGSEREPSCAIDGRQAVVGSLGWVKAALDAHADHDGIDGLADYRTARDRLGGDRLATLYVARSAMSVGGLPGALSSALPTASAGTADALAALPAWVMAGVRAEDNALVADVVSAPLGALTGLPGVTLAPGASLLTPQPAHASLIAPLVPSDTAVLFEVHGTGIALQNGLTLLRSMPELGGSLGQIDAALGSLGGVESLIGWIGDAGVVAMPDGPSATGGLVLLAADDATASAKAAQLASLVKLAALSSGSGANVTETTIDGTQVTLADFGDASGLLGGLGGAAGLGGISVPPGTHLVVSIAAHGSAILVGSGEAFARRIIETARGSALVDQASYRTAMALGASQNSGQLYVAAAPVLAMAEAAIPAADQARYQSDIKPYLAPLDALLETSTMDANGLRVRLVVTVK